MDKTKVTTLKQIARKYYKEANEVELTYYSLPWISSSKDKAYCMEQIGHTIPDRAALDKIIDSGKIAEQTIKALKEEIVIKKLSTEVLLNMFNEEMDGILSNGIQFESVYSDREEGNGDYDSWRYVIKTTHPEYDAPRFYSLCGYYDSRNGVDLSDYELENMSLVSEKEIMVTVWESQPEEDFDTDTEEVTQLYTTN